MMPTDLELRDGLSQRPGISEPRVVNILLVDDEPKNLTALESLLTAADRRLVRADSGPQALKHLLQDDFAVILLDVQMPEMDGFETAELIRGRERSRHTPIIFLTAAITGESHVAKGYSIGAVDYLIKPLDPDVLRSKVTVFIDLFRKTEQIRQQANELAETTALLNSVLEGATGFAIVALDLNANVVAWNEGARRIYGYDAAEVVGRAHFSMLHEVPIGGTESMDALLREVERNGRAEGSLEGISRAGRRFDVSLALEQRLSADRTLIGFVAIAQDVTAHREAERQAVRLLEERAARAEAERARDQLQQVVDVLPECVLVVNATGTVTICNAAARGLLGRVPPPEDHWALQTMGSIDSKGQERPLERYALVRSVRDGEIVRGEQITLPHGSTNERVPVLLNSAPVRASNGAIVGGVLVFQDITALKELERQKDDFLAAASHDLKNPLAIVKARAQLLQRQAERVGSDESAAMIDGLRAIDIATSRLVGMVNELLDVARLQMDRPIDLELKRIDLVALVRETVAETRASTDRHELKVDANVDKIFGQWDRDRIERVLVNLLTNAVKYSPEGGVITTSIDVEKDETGAWALIRVSDQGMGIPESDLANVFERFYRASNVSSRIDGAGIGLTGVRYIIERHRGEVTVESKLGSGSIFTVRLPYTVDA
jgi:PAS domain S-box-containing protein